MAGYWPSSLFAFLWTEAKSRSIKRKNRTWPIPSHLDRTSLVNKRFILWHKEHWKNDLRSCSFSSTEKETSYMLKWWRVPLYPDWINAENTIIWLVTYLKSKCQTSKWKRNKCTKLLEKNSQSFLFQPQNWCQNGLFQRLSSRVGLTIGEKQIAAWKALCTEFSHSLVKYQKSHSFAALTRLISGTSETRVKILYTRAFHKVISVFITSGHRFRSLGASNQCCPVGKGAPRWAECWKCSF